MSDPIRPSNFKDMRALYEEQGLQVQVQRPIRNFREAFIAAREAIHNAPPWKEKLAHLEDYYGLAAPYVSAETSEKLDVAYRSADAISGELKTSLSPISTYGYGLVIEQSKTLGSRSHLPENSPAHFQSLLDNERELRYERRFEILSRVRGFVDRDLAERGLIPKEPEGTMPGIGGAYDRNQGKS